MTEAMKQKLAFGLVCVLSLGLAFVFTDCIAGEDQFVESKVIDKNYSPAWVEVSSDTDSEGNSNISTIHHPPEWKLLTEQGWLRCSSGLYDKTQIGDVVTGTFRIGKWTKLHYLSRANP